MNLEAVKEILYDITTMFFAGATVIWSEQTNTKPPLPYVTLKTGAVDRTSFPIINKDGGRYYQCSTTLEVNLYTKGRPVTLNGKETGSFANTATSDLMDFFNFIDSDNIIDVIAVKGMDVSLIPPVRDLTELQNDSRYRYRAMAEAKVSFAEEADGPYGIRNMPSVPNSSGGGTAEMAEAETNTIEKVEIITEKEGGTDSNEE